ncbi:protein stoned-B-like [Vanessa atalanta]|uniref:protein stoned-B-like n=1 Tax=Vanessa atalanta TaxID=42275 RepID=UPI001FCDEFF1|nr:protein stoned-B-like [Vanessa atalanta]
MLKLPKGLKKKKKGKKSKRKGEEELFTEEELEKYRREHQQQGDSEGSAKENEEWSKFKDLTTGVDSILKKTQGDLDRIKSTSFFQRVPAGPKEVVAVEKEEPRRPVVEVTEADFPHLAAAAAAAAAEAENGEKSDYGVTDDESEDEDDQDDIFDTSYVDAVERGEVKLAYVPDSPEEFQDDDIFDTSHVDALIKGQEVKTSKGKKGLDIGVAVEVLTGRIDNVTVTSKRPKRIIPGDLLLDSEDKETITVKTTTVNEPVEKSILDIDTDIPINTPIDLSVSLHTALIQQKKDISEEDLPADVSEEKTKESEEIEVDEFTLLAAESLEVKASINKLEEKEINIEPVLQESWSAFEADKNETVFAEGIVEDQLDVLDPYIDQDDPFDTSFADAVIPTTNFEQVKQEAVILEDDDDFDPRAEEVQIKLNNRRKSSVRIHLINPSGIRESITSDDLVENEENKGQRDLLGGSTTDLTLLGDSPLDPVNIDNIEIDPFDTTIVDKIVAPGKVELKLLEQELIGAPASVTIYRVPSDPDFDPRADEPKVERRASRPENLTVSKNVVFDVDGKETSDFDSKSKPTKPLTPYYTREVSITEDLNEETETNDQFADVLTRTRSEEDLAKNITYQAKRRHSEYPQTTQNINNFKANDLLHDHINELEAKVLTPLGPKPTEELLTNVESDPFDTSFATDIKPSKTELKLLAKEFSCDNTSEIEGEADLLDPSDDIFQVKALTPEPPTTTRIPEEDFDPFDTSFASDLNPGRTEINMNEPVAPVTTEDLNPFMMSESDTSNFTPGDNPFATSNPFSDFENSYEPPAGDTVPVDIFGNAEPTGIGAKQFDETNSMDVFGNLSMDNERLVKPTELELVSTMVDCSYPEEEEIKDSQLSTRPLPAETQNLILTVTGQMEFTSSHLLDRIPPTRTPSPVSVRDIHSPSPTPEPDLLEENTSTVDNNRNKPARPPPARPPRPAPPPRPQQPPVTIQSAGDDINLFDAPAPTVVKPTKEAILSLYSAPKKEEKQIDFLSDDLPELSTDIETKTMDTTFPVVTSSSANESSNLIFNEPDSSMIVSTTESEEQSTIFEVQKSNAVDDVTVQMDCSEPSVEVNTTSPNASPFADITDNSYQVHGNESEKNPFEFSNPADIALFNQAESDITGFKSEDTVMTSTTNTPFTTEEKFITTPQSNIYNPPMDIFGTVAKEAYEDTQKNIFNIEQENIPTNQSATNSDMGWNTTENMVQDAFPESQDAFDAFSAKFDSTGGNHMNTDAWGDDSNADSEPGGFEAEAFDPFLSMGAPPPPAATPRLDHQGSRDSTDDTFSVFIRPKDSEAGAVESTVPVLAPPPRPQALPESPRVNPFDKNGTEPMQQQVTFDQEESRRRSGSGGETPPTPLFDDDVSMPLEDFPRTKYTGPGWEMHLRQPNKKKITGQRFWKKIFVRLACQGDNPVVQLLNTATDKEPLQELPLQACYSVSEVGAQQFDQFGKIFTVKLQLIFYKERPGVRPGQVTKAERITNKLSQFAAYAIQGDYQGVKEFGSDLRKLGLPVEHAPQVSQLFKLGSLSYEDVKQFSCCVEEALFRLSAHRDRALTYKMEEVQITAVDELYVEQDAEGSVLKQIARVRLFFLGFLSGMPDVELGVNDLRRQGKEVVGRHDIIPVVTEEWIRVEDVEFHACVQPQAFAESQIIKFKPPDACYIELMRFRVRPPKNRELPLQLKAVWCVTGNKVELRADALVPGFASRKLGQVPCEDVAVRFPIPECWIYLFRVEKHFRYGSVKSAHRRTGKIKGIERFLGAVDTLQESLIEVTSGQAKYEHQHRAIVWRMPRLPKEGQGAYTTHNLVCRMALTSYDQVPEELARWAHVEFTMPATQVSHTTVRSVSLQEHDGDPPEKYVRYLARHEYMVGIERTSGQAVAAYSLAATKEPEPPRETIKEAPREPSSDSDSD